MEHLFCNYELSLLAKEKGFKEKCIYSYFKDKTLSSLGLWLNYNESETLVSAPLYQQLIDFLISKNIWVEMWYNKELQLWECTIFTHPELERNENLIIHSENYYTTLTEGLTEGLKLIK